MFLENSVPNLIHLIDSYTACLVLSRSCSSIARSYLEIKIIWGFEINLTGLVGQTRKRERKRKDGYGIRPMRLGVHALCMSGVRCTEHINHCLGTGGEEKQSLLPRIA